ncbi:AraC family transcriptional regulator [Actinomadura rudentiformis]|uniref:AraC family transcriptional regulator n=1 Tax=Actinomadura rudentiformis TaxID=359158 RepID=UPI00178C430A|nr:AraC family transcriptional regulator [Actinomadura rudentiformis]
MDAHPAHPSRLPVLGTVSAHVMVQVAGEHGVPQDRCLEGTGIAPAVLEDARATIRLEQELALARNVMRELAHIPALGLVMASRYRLSVYGVLGWGMLCSPSVRDALAFAFRYLDLTYSCCGITPEEGDGELRVGISNGRLPADVRGFFAERSLSATIRLLGDLISGDGWLVGVEIAGPRPPHAGLYEDTFGVKVSFGGSRHAVRIDPDVLSEPMPLANRPMLDMIEDQCRQLLAQRRALLTLPDVLREHVLRRLPVLPSMGSAAAELGMSERTLRRRLAEEGSSFSAIVTDARRALAEELLLQGVPSLQVARQVGFAGPAAFTHAFKRWTGSSPREFAGR